MCAVLYVFEKIIPDKFLVEDYILFCLFVCLSVCKITQNKSKCSSWISMKLGRLIDAVPR